MNAPPLNMILIEDQVLLRQSLASLLSARLNLAVIGEFNSVAAVLAAPDITARAAVALVDIRLGKETTFGLVAELRRRAPALRAIWMTCAEEDFMLEEAYAARLPGFVHKEDSLEVIVLAIETVAAGGRYYSESIVRRRRSCRANPTHFSRLLSEREQEVLKLIGAGFSNGETAALLGLSAGTIQAHRRNIMAKLDIHSATELQTYALRCGFADTSSLKATAPTEDATR